MTTIIGIQGDGWAIIAADSRVSSYDGSVAYQSATMTPMAGKVAQNGKWLLAAAGDVRAINLLHHALVPPAPHPNLKGRKLDHFVTTKFVPALRECFEDNGYAMPDSAAKEHAAQHSSTILAVVNATIYVMDGDYSWTTDSTGLYAIGSGGQYALGAIHALRGSKGIDTPQQARTIATKAMSVSSRLDPYTGPPVTTHLQTTDTKNDKT